MAEYVAASGVVSFVLVVIVSVGASAHAVKQGKTVPSGHSLRLQLKADLEEVWDSEDTLDRVRDMMILKSSDTKEGQIRVLMKFLNDDPAIWP